VEAARPVVVVAPVEDRDREADKGRAEERALAAVDLVVEIRTAADAPAVAITRVETIKTAEGVQGTDKAETIRGEEVPGTARVAAVRVKAEARARTAEPGDRPAMDPVNQRPRSRLIPRPAQRRPLRGRAPGSSATLRA
jgi:hypothetical protein